jgi:hypothetical protein
VDNRTGARSESFGLTTLIPPSSAVLENIDTATSVILDQAAGIRTAGFLAYFGVILAIWSIEAVRSCNALMPVQL